MTDLPSTNDYPEVASVREVIEAFLADLSTSVPQTDLQSLLSGNQTLDDLDIGYQPEAYTEENLIHKLLKAVELTYQRQPKATDTQRSRWPDFELSNTNIPIIGESKPLNRVVDGEAEIKEYLSSDGFETPYGILTDGLEWRIYGPSPLGGTGGYTLVKQVTLREAARLIADQNDHIRLVATAGNPIDKITIPLTDFVTTFRREDLNQWTLLRLPREVRSQYATDDGFQTSFDDLF